MSAICPTCRYTADRCICRNHHHNGTTAHWTRTDLRHLATQLGDLWDDLKAALAVIATVALLAVPIWLVVHLILWSTK